MCSGSQIIDRKREKMWQERCKTITCHMCPRNSADIFIPVSADNFFLFSFPFMHIPRIFYQTPCFPRNSAELRG